MHFVQALLVLLLGGAAVCSASNSMLLSAPPGEPDYGVLDIREAWFGRHHEGWQVCKAPTGQNDTNVRCHKDITAALRPRCDGRRWCWVNAFPTTWGATCGNAWKYVQVSYACGNDPTVRVVQVCQNQQFLLTCVASSISGAWRDNAISVNQNGNGFVQGVFRLSNRPEFFGKREGNTVSLMFPDSNTMSKGYLSLDANTITFEDNNVWRRSVQPDTLMLREAVWGRTQVGAAVCPFPGKDTNTNCRQDATPWLGPRCNGQQGCWVHANNLQYGDPCAGTAKYIQVKYTCGTDATVRTATLCENDPAMYLNCIAPSVNGNWKNGDVRIVQNPDGTIQGKLKRDGRPDFYGKRSGNALMINYYDGQTDAEKKTIRATVNVEGDRIDFDDGTFWNRQADPATITVQSAVWGRLAPGSMVCPHAGGKDTTIGCSRNVMSVIGPRCNGQRACAFAAENGWYGDPCWSTYKYLRVEYTCGADPVVNTAILCEGQPARTISCQAPAFNGAHRWNNNTISLAQHGDGFIDGVYVADTTKPNFYGRRDGNNMTMYFPDRRLQLDAQVSIDGEKITFSDGAVWLKTYIAPPAPGRPPVPDPFAIFVTDASWGRTKEGSEICPRPADQPDAGSDCLANLPAGGRCDWKVDFQIRPRCNGQRQCLLPANTILFGDPCPQMYKYLTVKFRCGTDPQEKVVTVCENGPTQLLSCVPETPQPNFPAVNLEQCFWNRWEIDAAPYFGERTSTSHKACQFLCQATPGCLFYVWGDWGKCYLKGNQPSRWAGKTQVQFIDQSASGGRFISGPKYCPSIAKNAFVQQHAFLSKREGETALVQMADEPTTTTTTNQQPAVAVVPQLEAAPTTQAAAETTTTTTTTTTAAPVAASAPAGVVTAAAGLDTSATDAPPVVVASEKAVLASPGDIQAPPVYGSLE